MASALAVQTIDGCGAPLLYGRNDPGDRALPQRRFAASLALATLLLGSLLILRIDWRQSSTVERRQDRSRCISSRRRRPRTPRSQRLNPSPNRGARTRDLRTISSRDDRPQPRTTPRRAREKHRQDRSTFRMKPAWIGRRSSGERRAPLRRLSAPKTTSITSRITAASAPRQPSNTRRSRRRNESGTTLRKTSTAALSCARATATAFWTIPGQRTAGRSRLSNSLWCIATRLPKAPKTALGRNDPRDVRHGRRGVTGAARQGFRAKPRTSCARPSRFAKRGC